jgi:hypothetical protein
MSGTTNQPLNEGVIPQTASAPRLHNDSFNRLAGLRFWERLKHLARGRCIFFTYEQLIVNAVISDCCENVCGQKRTLQNFHLDLRCTHKQYEFIVLRQGKKTSRRGCIFFAHKHPMSQAAPCQMFSHTTSSIRLNHRINAGRLKDAFRNLGLAFSSVRLNNNQITLRHALSVPLE